MVANRQNTIFGQHLTKRDIKKVLLCHGGDRAKRDGLFDTVSKNLEEKGVERVEFGGTLNGLPLLEVTFRTNLARRFPETQQQAIVDVSLNHERLLAMPAHAYVDLYDL